MFKDIVNIMTFVLAEVTMKTNINEIYIVYIHFRKLYKQMNLVKNILCLDIDYDVKILDETPQERWISAVNKEINSYEGLKYGILYSLHDLKYIQLKNILLNCKDEYEFGYTSYIDEKLEMHIGIVNVSRTNKKSFTKLVVDLNSIKNKVSFIADTTKSVVAMASLLQKFGDLLKPMRV